MRRAGGLQPDLAGEWKRRFHLAGLKEGEIAVLPIGRELYERTLADKARSLRNPPFDTMLTGPYRSIRMLEAQED